MTNVGVSARAPDRKRPTASDPDTHGGWPARFARWFIPPRLQNTPPEDQRRAVVIMWFWVAILVWSPVYCGIYYCLDCPRAVIVVATGTVLAFSIPLTLRLTGSVWLAGNMFTLAMLTVLAALIALTGGRDSPVRVWLILIPILAAVLAGLRSSILWTGLVVMIRIGLEVLNHHGMEMASELTADGQHVLSIFSLTTVLILTGAFAWMYDRIQERAMVSIEGQAEELRENERLLANIISTIPYSVFWKDREYRFLGCNQRFAEAVGMADPAEVVGKTDYDLSWSTAAVDEYRRCDQQIIESGEPLLNIEEPYQRMDGTAAVLLTCKVPLRRDDGEVIGILGIFRDITEHKVIEQRLRLKSSAMAAAGNAVMITDMQGDICWVNPAFTKMTGYSPEEVVGRNPRFLKSDSHDAAFYARMWREISAGRMWSGEMINRRKDGTLYPEEMTIAPVREEHGEVTHFVALKQDITDRKRAECLVGERDRLREAVKAHEHMLGVVGHELRTPLAGLMIIAEYLTREDTQNTVEFGEFVHNIREEVARMSNVVNDMLEVSRLNSGIAKWNWGGVSVQQACADAAASIQPLIDPACVHLSVCVDPPELSMRGDESAIRRLVLNLLCNARKHTNHGSIAVKARAMTCDDPPYVELVVTDTGSGMTRETVDRLGEAFALNSGAIGDKHVSGSGLGLSICRGIVSAHGGSIAVTSTLNHGTKCTVRLRADLDSPCAFNELTEILIEANS